MEMHRPGERGSALVTAILVMMLFTILGFTALSLVDVQQRESGRERVRESSFALAEGALSAQIYALSTSGGGWPASAPGPTQPATCTESTAAESTPRCPIPARVTESFQGADYERSPQWSTELHDNRVGSETCTTPPSPGSNFYDDVTTRQQPAWDANCDGFLWVRAQATVNERRRTLVALVRAEQLGANMPRYGVVAGGFSVTTNGNHVYLNSGTSGKVIVRCSTDEAGCANYHKGGRGRTPHVLGQVVTDPAFQPALTPETIERLRDTAKANGTYYASGCVPTLAGALVFIETADCGSRYDPPGKTAYNSAENPGVLVIGSGHLEFGGNATYYGLIYHVNGSDKTAPSTATCPVNSPVALDIGPGATRVVGGVLIDGCGRLNVGTNNGGPEYEGNLVFDARAFDNLRVYGTAGIVQNSFREIRPAP